MSDNETFDAARRLLTNIRSVRVFARETSFEQLLEMQEKLNAVIEERREDAEREAAERQEREKNVRNCFSSSLGKVFLLKSCLV